MAKKKKRKKRNQKKKILILTAAGVLVLAAAGAAGFLLYQNVFSGSREDVLEEYMACIMKNCILFWIAARRNWFLRRTLLPEIRISMKGSRFRISSWRSLKTRTGGSRCLTA